MENAKEINDGRRMIRWLVGLSLLGGALGYRYWYPQGAQSMQQAVFGRDGQGIESAFAAFEDSYGEHESFVEAVEAFCAEP